MFCAGSKVNVGGVIGHYLSFSRGFRNPPGASSSMLATRPLMKSAPATISMPPHSGMPLSQPRRLPKAKQSNSHKAKSFGAIRGARMGEGLTLEFRVAMLRRSLSMDQPWKAVMDSPRTTFFYKDRGVCWLGASR